MVPISVNYRTGVRKQFAWGPLRKDYMQWYWSRWETTFSIQGSWERKREDMSQTILILLWADFFMRIPGNFLLGLQPGLDIVQSTERRSILRPFPSSRSLQNLPVLCPPTAEGCSWHPRLTVANWSILNVHQLLGVTSKKVQWYFTKSSLEVRPYF